MSNSENINIPVSPGYRKGRWNDKEVQRHFDYLENQTRIFKVMNQEKIKGEYYIVAVFKSKARPDLVSVTEMEEFDKVLPKKKVGRPPGYLPFQWV